jgi:hypothetical protein
MPVRRVYRSTDTGAPVMSGSVGALATLLDTILVNGYATQAISSMTSSGTTVTVTLAAAHGWLKTAKVTIAGANQTEYNGEFSVTVTGLNTFTYTALSAPSASPATTSTSLTAKIAGSGWSIAYTGTNVRSYLQGTTLGAGSVKHMFVDDTGTVNARFNGFEAQTSATMAGTGDFPTIASQVVGGMYMVKSDAASTAARGWIAITTSSSISLFIDSLASQGSSGSWYFFGDVVPYLSTDAYGTLIMGATSSSYSSNQGHVTGGVASTQSGKYLCRSYTAIGGSMAAGTIGDTSRGATNIGTGGLTYPAPVDGGLYMSPLEVNDYTSANPSLRGLIPGIWNPLHSKPLVHNDTFSGAGALAGKIFQVFNIYSSAQAFIEISDT